MLAPCSKQLLLLVRRLLLPLLRGTLCALLPHRGPLPLEQCRLGALLAGQRRRLLRGTLRLLLPLGRSPAVVLGGQGVLCQPPLQRHLRQPAIHGGGAGRILLLADAYRLRQAAASQLEILAAVSGFSNCRRSRPASQRQPALSLCLVWLLLATLYSPGYAR